MGLWNIIWIVIFLVLGAGLTIQAFDTINFGAWDNIFGILMILIALFGIYCMTKDTSPFVMRIRRKYGPVKRRLEVKLAGIFRLKNTGSNAREQADAHHRQPVKTEAENSVSVQNKRPQPMQGPPVHRHRAELEKAHDVKAHFVSRRSALPKKAPSEPAAGQLSSLKGKPSAHMASASGHSSIQRKEPAQPAPLQAAENTADKNYLESLEEILREVDTVSGADKTDEINLNDLME